MRDYLAPREPTERRQSHVTHKTDSANTWWAVATSIMPGLVFSLRSCVVDRGATADCEEEQFSLSHSSWSDAVDSVLWMRSRIGCASSAVWLSSPTVAIKSSSKYSGLFTAVGDVQTPPSHWPSDRPPTDRDHLTSFIHPSDDEDFSLLTCWNDFCSLLDVAANRNRIYFSVAVRNVFRQIRHTKHPLHY